MVYCKRLWISYRRAMKKKRLQTVIERVISDFFTIGRFPCADDIFAMMVDYEYGQEALVDELVKAVLAVGESDDANNS